MPLVAEGIEAEAGGKVILKGVTLELREGEVLAVMGPNGSGKTTLANVIAGSPSVSLKKGRILIDGEDVTELPPEERVLRGLMLLFQSPPEIKGVKLSTLMIASFNKRRGLSSDLLKVTDPSIFSKMRSSLSVVGLSDEYLYREVNVGFSGGEKKRSELAQAMMLDPKYVIMDEPDSGLDIDGLRVVGEIISRMKREGRSVLLITHYTRLFSTVKPDRISVLMRGRIVAQGGMEIAEEIDRSGYSKLAERLGVELNND
ncbi:MAG: Fe-S cluster assembly ATPase SufC [Fervidicoccaceae archaeon]